MIRVTLTNSKLDKELGRKKKTSTEDFLFSRKELTAFLPQKHIITFCKCSQKSLRFYPSSYFIFTFIQNAILSFHTSPLARVQIRTPFCARM